MLDQVPGSILKTPYPSYLAVAINIALKRDLRRQRPLIYIAPDSVAAHDFSIVIALELVPLFNMAL